MVISVAVENVCRSVIVMMSEAVDEDKITVVVVYGGVEIDNSVLVVSVAVEEVGTSVIRA